MKLWGDYRPLKFPWGLSRQSLNTWMESCNGRGGHANSQQAFLGLLYIRAGTNILSVWPVWSLPCKEDLLPSLRQLWGNSGCLRICFTFYSYLLMDKSYLNHYMTMCQTLTLFHLNGVFWDPAEMNLLIIFKSVWHRCQYFSYSSITRWLFRKI